MPACWLSVSMPKPAQRDLWFLLRAHFCNQGPRKMIDPWWAMLEPSSPAWACSCAISLHISHFQRTGKFHDVKFRHKPVLAEKHQLIDFLVISGDHIAMGNMWLTPCCPAHTDFVYAHDQNVAILLVYISVSCIPGRCALSECNSINLKPDLEYMVNSSNSICNDV